VKNWRQVEILAIILIIVFVGIAGFLFWKQQQKSMFLWPVCDEDYLIMVEVQPDGKCIERPRLDTA